MGQLYASKCVKTQVISGYYYAPQNKNSCALGPYKNRVKDLSTQITSV